MRLKSNTIIPVVTSALMLALAVSSHPAQQEGFHNPAMETSEEFKRSFKRASDLARRDPEAAIDEFKKAAGLRGGKCPECHQSIAQIYFQFGEYNNAAAAFRQAVELKPSNAADLYNALGVSLYLLKDKKMYDEAIIALNHAIDLSKGRLAKAYFNLGCALIKAGREEEGVTALKTYLERAPSSADAEDARRMIANPKLVGESFARGFKVKSTAGDDLSLEKFKGKVVLLDFWAVWCGPCRADMPQVRKIWKKYSQDQFVIIGVNLDSNRTTFESYVEQEGLTWPHYYDGLRWDNKIARLYGVTAIPHTVLIDQEGIIRGVGLKPGGLSSKIGELLKKSQSDAAAPK
ncbi:MAG TPA: redoxin domain-containing protein [Blastocatellia bacterium]|nr:redoxin domain-containing protein [Blastocatellia bacterium]